MSEAKRILVVEDDDVARELVRRTLVRRGYDVTTAADGIEAYDLALKITPDLIITDIHMPSADGAHFVRRVRDTPGLLITPIIVTTGYGTGNAALTLSQGADAFEPKPVDPESLLRSVERLLSKETL
jgi:two-component system response regulator TctD